MAHGSSIFRSVLHDAREQLMLEFRKSASAFGHSGIKGDERAAALGRFFRERLPEIFSVAKSEVIDYKDQRSGQLDVLIFDTAFAAPLTRQSENLLVPCESLYVVFEVKSILNRQEIGRCLRSAQKLRRLRPFKEHFVAAREQGRAAKDKSHRFLYIVFAYETDLSKDDWLAKEWNRLIDVSVEDKAEHSCIDRLFIVDRGIINPARGHGKVIDDDADLLFLELYLHVMNFLQREKNRRPEMNWQIYSLPRSRGWKAVGKLTKT
jgi:uncharacterized protein DUF6602